MSDRYTELYDTIYQRGYHRNIEMTHTPEVIGIVKKLISTLGPPKSLKVLDMGCSHGKGMTMLSDLGLDVWGFDISPTAVQKAIDRGIPEDRVKVGSATDIPYDDQMFDILVSSDVMEHLYPTDIYTALQEGKRVAKYAAHNIALTREKQKHHLENLHKLNKFKDVKCLHPSLFNFQQWHGFFQISGYKRVDSEVVRRNDKAFKYTCVYES